MFLLASIAASGPVAPAYAAGGGAESEGGNSNKTLDLSNLVVPVERDGELINYLFVSVVVTVNDGQDHWKLRERAHVLRDLILKETHRKTVGLEGEPMKLDEEKMKAVEDDKQDILMALSKLPAPLRVVLHRVKSVLQNHSSL